MFAVFFTARRDAPSLSPTALLVEADLGLVLLPLLQSPAHLLRHALAGVAAVQEAAAAVLLHHLGPGEARQFAEAVRAVDDGVAAVALGVPQQEVTVCKKKNNSRSFAEVNYRTQGNTHVISLSGCATSGAFRHFVSWFDTLTYC